MAAEIGKVQEHAEPFEVIETRRLRLRCARLEDAKALSLLMTPAVSAWVAAWPVPLTPAMARERITAARAAAVAGNALPCVIEHRSDNTVLGWINVTRDGGKGMLGYWLGETHQGRGFMREAALAFVMATFRLLEIEEVEAAAQPGNAASFAVLRACGMVPAGERLIFASARNRDELCLVYRIGRGDHLRSRAK